MQSKGNHPILFRMQFRIIFFVRVCTGLLYMSQAQGFTVLYHRLLLMCSSTVSAGTRTSNAPPATEQSHASPFLASEPAVIIPAFTTTAHATRTHCTPTLHHRSENTNVRIWSSAADGLHHARDPQALEHPWKQRREGAKLGIGRSQILQNLASDNSTETDPLSLGSCEWNWTHNCEMRTDMHFKPFKDCHL